MRFEGSTEFMAERPAIYSILIEPSRIGPCAPVPIERVDDRHFKATTKVGSGLFSAKVSLELEVVEAIENESVRLEGHGRGLGDHAVGQHVVPAAGRVDGRDDRVEWVAEVELEGMLAGPRVADHRGRRASRRSRSCWTASATQVEG